MSWLTLPSISVPIRSWRRSCGIWIQIKAHLSDPLPYALGNVFLLRWRNCKIQNIFRIVFTHLLKVMSMSKSSLVSHSRHTSCNTFWSPRIGLRLLFLIRSASILKSPSCIGYDCTAREDDTFGSDVSDFIDIASSFRTLDLVSFILLLTLESTERNSFPQESVIIEDKAWNVVFMWFLRHCFPSHVYRLHFHILDVLDHHLQYCHHLQYYRLHLPQWIWMWLYIWINTLFYRNSSSIHDETMKKDHWDMTSHEEHPSSVSGSHYVW